MPVNFGLDPDLQKMGHAAFVVIELGVTHAGARAHALHITGNNGRAIAHRIFVRQRTIQHITDDFHVAVTMGTEAGTGLHAILVDHAQRAVADVVRVVVIGK